MTMLLRIAERVLNRPLLVHPDKVPLILSVLDGRIPLGDISDLRRAADLHIAAMPQAAQTIMRGKPKGSRFFGENAEVDPQTGRAQALPYRRTAEGVAVISVLGGLVNRGTALQASSLSDQSYEGIKFQIAKAVADPRTKAILLDIESPGGEAVGTFEAASAIREAAKQKPITAVVNGMAASAAYAIASGASKIVTTSTGLAGSIGVVMMHADYSRALDEKGITPTLIFAGAHKVDGNPLEPLSPAVREDLQNEVDRFYSLFVKTVAQGRKGLSVQAIRATEARTFIGKDAIDQGLADELGTFESALADLTRGASRATTSMSSKGMKMDNREGAPAADAGQEYVTIEAHRSAVAEARETGLAEGAKQGRKAAHERISAIVADEKVKGKETIALDLAVKSPKMSADDVVAFVAGLPTAQPAKTVPTIEERMNGQGGALALGGPITSPVRDASNGWDAAIASVNASFGIKH